MVNKKPYQNITSNKHERKDNMNRRKFLIFMCILLAMAALPWATDIAYAGPGSVPDLSYPGGARSTYYANSPAGVNPFNASNTGAALRKFVDPLPGVCGLPGTAIPTVTGGAGTPLANKCISIANPQPSPVPGDTADYYEIALVEYTEFMHADLPKGTKLRGYVQLNDPANPVTIAGGHVTAGPQPHYLGPVILATKGKPVRIKFFNMLPTGAAGDLFLPVDTTFMGAGTGPNGGTELYTDTRATLHLHGGFTPWISDGTPHQWVTPAGETALDAIAGHTASPTSYPVGVSAQNVPDMPGAGIPSGGWQTFYYTNLQSGRLMFYHDHAYGITRLNVYAGMAAGYLLSDPTGTGEWTLPIPGKLTDLGHLVPLVIQDKTFVPADIATQDSKWTNPLYPNRGVYGDLWFPHVYEPNQDPFYSADGTNPVGRWDYGPWFWPIFPVDNPVLPEPSGVPEAFMDTPVVNGTAYPYLDVQPTAYRFRILSAGNDRALNLGLYVADPAISVGTAGLTEVKMLPAVPHVDALGNPIPTADGLPPCAPGVTSGLPNFVSSIGGVLVTNPASGCWPDTWPTDGRDGGVPDPRTAGPDIIVFGSEGGLLPKPAVIPSTPTGYEYFRRSVTVLNVLTKGLMLGPAERADAVIDFSRYAGQTLILYNDAPAPVPAFDTRIDYYTGNPDQNASGGAPSTLAGFGPNTRTIMQIRVATGTPVAYTGCTPIPAPPGAPSALDCTALATPLATAFTGTQDPPIVAQAAYGAFPDQFAKIYTGSSLQPTWTFTDGNGVSQTAAVPNPTLYPIPPNLPPGATIPLLNKAIQELFEPVYGRMNATLGVELPFTSAITQTTIPLGYIDPSTETVPAGQTQMWKITHNGVDSHWVHFHLINVQVINRVGWDGTIKPPDENEVGWKETVRMNPLEDIIVAARMKVPPLPFGVPTSSRFMDVTSPAGSSAGFTQVDPATGNPAAVVNAVADFGWEYVWHCHILGHEENDMMRPLVVQVASVAPAAPGLSAALAGTLVNLTWTDATPPATSLGNPANEIGFLIQRATGATGGTFAQIGTALANATTYADATAASGTTYRYRVIAYNAAGSSVSNTATVIMPSGTPVLNLSQTALSFSTPLNIPSAFQTVIVSNTGNAPLTINNIVLGGTNPGQFNEINNCPASLPAGQNCTITVNFSPTTATPLTKSASLNVNVAAPAISQPVSLTGTIVVPIFTSLPAALTFSSALNTTSAAQTVTVTNTGTAAPLTINSITLGGTNPGQFAQTNSLVFPATLAPGANFTISVTFRPTTATPLTKSALLNINVAAPATSQSVSLTGNILQPAATVSPTTSTGSPYNFGNVTRGTTPGPALTVTVQNTGAAPLNFNATNGFTLNGANPGQFTLTTGGAGGCVNGGTLAVGGSCTVTVRFRPTTGTALGVKNATLNIRDNAPGSPQPVYLRGTAQ